MRFYRPTGTSGNVHPFCSSFSKRSRALLLLLVPLFAMAQTSYTWNGSLNGAWNNAANWTPSTGFPLAADHATIVAAGTMPILDMARSVTNLTVSSGSLDLAGFTLTHTGNGSFSGGAVNNGTLSPNTAAGSTTFSGTTFGAAVSGTSAILLFNGSVFNAPVAMTKTGGANDYSTGNNTFNGTATFTVTNGRLYLNNTGIDTFNGNVVLNSTGASNGVWLGQSSGSASLANGRTISTGTYSAGSLLFRNFTQVGSTPQVLLLSLGGTLYFQSGSTFNGDVTSSSPGLYLNGATFNGTATFTKTGASNEYSSGNNTFNGMAEFRVTGPGNLFLNNTGNDQFNGDLLLSNTSTGGIRFGASGGTSVLAAGRTMSVGSSGFSNGILELRGFSSPGTVAQTLALTGTASMQFATGTTFGGNLSATAATMLVGGLTVQGNARFTKTGPGNDWSVGGCTFNGDVELTNTGIDVFGMHNSGSDVFNGNIVVNNTSTGSVRFGWSGGTGTLAAGKTVTVGSGGYANGYLIFRNFTQLGATPQNIFLGTNGILWLNNSTFNGDISTTSGNIEVSGSQFLGTAHFTKTGSGNDGSAGGNIFHALTRFTAMSGGIYMGESGTNTFNGDIEVNCLGTGGVRFGWGGGSSTLAAGRTVTVGSGGFNNGILLFRNFTQLGTTPQNLVLGTGATLYFYANNVFNGNVATTSGSIYVASTTFNGTCSITKSGAGTDACPGGNTFQADLELINLNTGGIYMAESATDLYNGNVKLTNPSTGQIRFGNGGGGATLASGRTISVGVGGFNGGLMLFRNFTQVGTTPQSITVGINAALYIYPGSTFHAPLTTSSGQLYLSGGTYHSPCVFTKSGTGADGSPGGNLFNDRVELVNAVAGHIYMAQAQPDQYNGDLVVNNGSTGSIRFGDSGVTTSTLAAGRTITVGSGGFTSGLLLLRGFIQLGNTPQNLTLGTSAGLYYYAGSVFNGDVTSTSGTLYFYSATFNGTGRFTKSGTGGDGSYGGNFFNGYTELNNLNSGFIYMAENLGDAYNGDLVLNNNNSGQIRFGSSGIASSTLAAGRTVSVGGSGFNAGLLLFRNFMQTGPTAQTLNLGSLATLYFYPGTVFNGNVVTTSGGVVFYQSTFNGTGKFTKTGTSSDQCIGGNVFNGNTELINTSSGVLYMADVNGDAYNADLIVNSTSSGQIRFGNSAVSTSTLAAGRTFTIGSLGYNTGQLWFRKFIHAGTSPVYLPMGTVTTLNFVTDNVFNGNMVTSSGALLIGGTTFNGTVKMTKTGPSGDASPGNNAFNGTAEFINANTGNLSLNYNGFDQFNGDILLNNTGSGGINFGQNTGSAVLAVGRTIAVGSLGYNAGSLTMRSFTQLGGTPQSLLLGTSATLSIQNGNTFNGDLTTTSATLFINGSTFNGTSRFTKTGASGDGSNGGNTFNANTEFTVTGTGNLSIHQTLVDAFNGDIRVNSTSTGMITFGASTGSGIMAAGRTIGVGTLGFNTGTLSIRNFTQLGVTTQSLMLGNAAQLFFNTGNTFNGNIAASAGNLYLNGSTFNGTGWFRKAGNGSNACTGGNTYNGVTELVNISPAVWYHDNTQPDAFNADLLLNSTGVGGINFGNSTGSATLIGTLGIGSLGWTAGTISFRNFTKLSSNATTLSGSVSSALHFLANNIFNGDITTTSGNLLFNGTTFNGYGVFTKTATANNASTGGNTFNGDVEINAGGTITMAGSAADDFNGNATFRRLAAGTFTVNNTFSTTFSKNVSTVGSTGGPVQFGAGTGRTIFDGTTVQTFSSDATAIPNVRNLTLAMTGAGELRLLGSVNVQLDMAFASGVIKPMAPISTSNGLLILANGITFSDPADNASYVDGFVRKVGNSAFCFPVGNAGVLAPIAISAPTTATHHFTAKYVHDDSHPIHTHTMHDITLHHLSRCEYWILDRTNSTTNVVVTLSYDSVNSCGVTDLSDLVVARWNGTTWKDHGNGGTTGTLAAGTIMTAGPVTAFSPFTLASRTSLNPLPIELVQFDAAAEGNTVLSTWSTAAEMDNDYFEVERSSDGNSFEPIGTVEGAGFSQGLLNYAHVDGTPLSGTSYYRLKQVDFDGTATYSQVVPVVRDNMNTVLHIWPNPVVGMVNFTLVDGRTAISVQVHDAAGRLLVDQNSGTAEGNDHIDLANVPTGILFLSVRLDDGSVHQLRIVKH